MPTTTRRRWPDESSCPRSTERVNRTGALLAVCLAVGWGAGLAAQTPPAAQSPPPGSVPAVIRAEPSDQSATLLFFNRPIVVLRARVLGRSPAERAEAARRALDDLVASAIAGPVEWQAFDGGALITVASRGVLALTSPDVDELSGETVEVAAVR